MANKINLKGGRIEFKQGIIFFGIPDEGDKFVITCESAVLNTHNPEPNSLVLCLEDIYYEVNEQALNDFVAAFYVTPAEVAEFLEDEFSFNISFTTLYDINRDNNIITITKKTNEHFIGECKLIITDTVKISSITFTEDIVTYNGFLGETPKYVKLILSINEVELIKEYTQPNFAMGNPPISKNIITSDFKTLFDTHSTLPNNYIMTKDGATLTVKNKDLLEDNPILNLEKDFMHSSLTYKYTGTLNSLRDTSATFKIYPSNPAFDHYDVYVLFTPPNPVPPGNSWVYNKIEHALNNHDDWGNFMSSGDLEVMTEVISGATVSFTLYWHPAGEKFNEVGTVIGTSWSLDNKTTWLLLYNYTGYTINNNDFIPCNAPEFTYTEQLIRGQLIEEEE